MEFSMVMPGSAPATMPMVSPSRIMARFSGCTALTKPTARCGRISVIRRRSSEEAERAVERQGERLEGAVALREREVHRLDEHVEEPDGAERRRQPDGDQRPRPAERHEGRDEQAGGQGEAQRRGEE